MIEYIYQFNPNAQKLGLNNRYEYQIKEITGNSYEAIEMGFLFDRNDRVYLGEISKFKSYVEFIEFPDEKKSIGLSLLDIINKLQEK